MNCCGKFSLNFLYLFYYKIKDVPSKYIDSVFEIDTKIDTISLCCLGNPTYCLICVHENKKNIRGKKYPISPEKHLRASKNHRMKDRTIYDIKFVNVDCAGKTRVFEKVHFCERITSVYRFDLFI